MGWWVLSVTGEQLVRWWVLSVTGEQLVRWWVLSVTGEQLVRWWVLSVTVEQLVRWWVLQPLFYCEQLFINNVCVCSEFLLGPVPGDFRFLPKHKANAYQ